MSRIDDEERCSSPFVATSLPAFPINKVSLPSEKGGA
jgi:hypothetical protein